MEVCGNSPHWLQDSHPTETSFVETVWQITPWAANETSASLRPWLVSRAWLCGSLLFYYLNHDITFTQHFCGNLARPSYHHQKKYFLQDHVVCHRVARSPALCWPLCPVHVAFQGLNLSKPSVTEFEKFISCFRNFGCKKKISNLNQLVKGILLFVWGVINITFIRCRASACILPKFSF
jgi:hypothetical protein